MTDLPEHVAVNRQYWDSMAHEWVEMGERAWADEPSWGEWGVPESELGLLPTDMTGIDAIELGCGTGYISGWLARRGAKVVGIDNSTEQLKTAARLAAAHEVDIEWIHGNAETVPKPPSANTGPRSGPIRSCGFLRRTEFFDPADPWCFWATTSSWLCAHQSTVRFRSAGVWSVPTSACIASIGAMR